MTHTFAGRGAAHPCARTPTRPHHAWRVIDRIADAFAGTHAGLLASNHSRDEEAALRRAFASSDDGVPAVAAG